MKPELDMAIMTPQLANLNSRNATVRTARTPPPKSMVVFNSEANYRSSTPDRK